VQGYVVVVVGEIQYRSVICLAGLFELFWAQLQK
jgi:hypothetical protein